MYCTLHDCGDFFKEKNRKIDKYLEKIFRMYSFKGCRWDKNQANSP